MYNKDGAKLFDNIDDVPQDYVDCPSKVKLTEEAPKAKGRPKKEVKED